MQIDLQKLKRYFRSLQQKGISTAEMKQKLKSVDNFVNWANKKGLLTQDKYKQLNQGIAEIRKKIASIFYRIAPETWGNWLKRWGGGPHFVSTKRRNYVRGYKNQDTSKSVFVRPWFNISPSEFDLRHYIGISMILLVMAAMGAAAYNQFFKEASTPFAFPVNLTKGGRILSFQGRLTDSLGNPITTATNLKFKLYNASTGGTNLYDSTACSLTPDQDGVFDVLIGGTSYSPTPPQDVCGTEIPENIFSDWPNVYLGVTIGSDSEATPRQQIANVGYAINAETLKGFPPGTGFSNIPYINSDGDIIIATSAAGIRNSWASTNFTLSSTGTITVQSAGSGDVALTATESGNITATTGLGTTLFNVLTGNLKVGNGAPGVSLDGEDAYIEGTLEVDGGTTLDGTTLDINSTTITIADTDISFDGASTTFTTTGAFTLTPGGSVILGDGGDTLVISTSDWDIDATGAMTNMSFDANGTGNSITNIETADIADGTISEVDLKVVDTAVDEECLSYETTTGDFEWQTCGGGVTADSLDFTDFTDTMSLDADTSIAAGAAEELTYNKTFTDATSENGFVLNFTASDTSAGTTAQYGLYLDNVASTEGLDASLVIDNSDIDDVVADGILFVDAGGTFTDFIDTPSSVFKVDGSGNVTVVDLVISGGNINPSAALTLGDGGDTLVINTSDWDIDATGAMTNMSFDANGTGNSITNIETADIADGTISEVDLKVVDTAVDEECLSYETTTGDFEWQTCGGGVTADSLDFVDFEDTLDLDANLTLNQTTYTWAQDFTGTTTTGYTYSANSLTTGTGVSLTSTSTAGGASGSSKVLNIARSGANAQLAHTAYGIYSTVTNTNVTSGTNIAGYFSASGATTANYGLIVEAGDVGIGTTAPGALLQVAGSTIISSSASSITSTAVAALQVNGTTAALSAIGQSRWSVDANGSNLVLSKSRSATIGTNSIVSSDDTLGILRFNGDDGAAFLGAAYIQGVVDGTPGTNDMPGRLVFATTLDGASAPTERMRIDNAGNVGIGDTSPAAHLVVGSDATITYANGAGDVYVQNDLEVDGIIYGAVSGDLTCTDCIDFIDFEDTLDLDANLTLNQTTYTWAQDFTGTTTTGYTYSANALTTGTGVSLTSTSTAGGASGSSKVLNISRSGANAQLAHTAYGIYSAVTNTNATSGTNIAGYFSASGATTANYGLIVENGSVGIGNTAPLTKLHVTGTAGVSGAVGDTFPTSLSSGLAAQSYVTHAGSNWGFVVARAAADTGYANLTLYHTLSTDPATKTALASGDGVGRINFQGPVDSSNVILGASINGLLDAAPTAGTAGVGILPVALTFSTQSIAAGAAERMRIDSTGNVGIGTTAPAGLLHVKDSSTNINFKIDTDDLTDPYSLGVDTSAAGRKIVFSSETGSLRQGMVFSDSAASTDTIFGVSSSSDSGSTWSPRFIIEQAGNVGIGTTAPGATLEINDLQANDTPGSGQKLRFSYGGTGLFGWRMTADNNHLILDKNWASWDPVMSINRSSGNVGIGTTGPLAKLHVAGGSTVPAAELGSSLVTGSTTAMRLAMGVDNTSTMYSWIQSVENGSTQRALALQPIGGNVGIGSTSPDAKLDIEAAEDTEFIRLTNSTAGDSIGVYTGTGSPEGVVTAQLGSIYSDSSEGKVYKKGSGDGTSTGWEEVTTGSGAHMAKMRRDAAQTINHGALTKIAFDAEEYDVGDIADSTTNDRFNIKKAGKYLITASLSIPNIDDNEWAGVIIYKNGTRIREQSNYSPGANLMIRTEVTITLELAVNDYIEMYAFHWEGGAQNTYTTTADQPQMSVVQLDAAGGGNPEIGARVYNSVAQSINTGSSTALTFNSERYDTYNIHSTSSNTNRLTAPTAGKYLITGNFGWSPHATGIRWAYIRVNGSTTIVSDALMAVTCGGCGTDQNLSTVYSLNANDYVEFIVHQTSGGALNVNSQEFTMTKIDGGVNSTLQTAYNSGNTITTTDARDVSFTLADTTTDSDFSINMAGAGDFEILDAGTVAFTVIDTGNVGIGTTAPNANLSIGNNVATGFLDTYDEYQIILYDGGAATTSYGLGIIGNTMVFNSGAGAYSFDRGAGATSMYIDTAGKVGIGDTSPAATLTVGDGDLFQVSGSTGDITTAGDINVNGGNIDTTSALLAIENVLYVDGPSGEVGIGTTAPEQKLHVNAGASTGLVFPLKVQGATSTGVDRGPAIMFTTGQEANRGKGALAYIDDNTGFNRGYFAFIQDSVADTNTVAFADTKALVITNAGNVGIGTTGPATKLHIVGSSQNTLAVDSPAYPEITHRVNGTIISYDAIATTAGGYFANSILNSRIFYANVFQFGNASGASMTLTGGQLGIGTTAPGSILELYKSSVAAIGPVLTLNNPGGTAGAGAAIDFKGVGTQTTHARIYTIDVNGFASDLRFQTKATGTGGALTERMTIDEAGNVGIATTAPVQKLEVQGATYALPATSGSATDGTFRMASSGHGEILDMGIGGGLTWLQSRLLSNYATNYSLLLNPNGGNVGIGTTSPAINLEVRSDGTGTWQGRMGLSNSTMDRQVFFGNYGSSAAGVFAHNFALNAWADLWLNTVSGTTGMIVKGDGNVGIGTTAPGYKLTVNSSTPGCNGCTAWTNYSDIRLKDNVASLSGAVLDKIMELKPVTFNYNDTYYSQTGYSRPDGTTPTFTGFVAQDLQQIFPEMVSTASSGYLDTNLSNLQIYLVKGIQELANRTKTLNTLDNGNVGIGTTSPNYDLEVAGDVAANSFVNVSTKSAKKNISYINESDKNDFLSKIKNLKIAKYDYKTDSGNSASRLGLIAEESPFEVLAEGGKGVDLYKLTTLALGGIQVQEEKIETLEEEVERGTWNVELINNAIKNLITEIANIKDSIASLTTSLKELRGASQNDKLISPVVETEFLEVKSEARIPKLETEIIAPKEKDLVIDLSNPTSQDATLGAKGELSKLIIKGLNDNKVAEFDAAGNVRLQGDLTARHATLSGTLTSAKVETSEGRFHGDISASQASISGKLIAKEIESDNINSLTRELVNSKTDINDIQKFLADLQNQPVSNVANYQDAETINNLNVTGDTSLYRVFISNTLTTGNILIDDNKIMSLDFELKLTALSSINLLDGQVIISKTGGLTTKGPITALAGIKTNKIEPLNPNENVFIKNLETNKLQISDKYLDATNSAAIITASENFYQNGTYTPAIETKAETAGIGLIKRQDEEIIVYNDSITKDSLVYLTPTVNTSDNVLSVIKKEYCVPTSPSATLGAGNVCKPYFKVSTAGQRTSDVKFNWLIIN